MKLKFLSPILLVTFIQCQTNQENIKPNILLIMADDMGYGDVSGIGNPYLQTPNLDRLASQSISFKNFYVSPVCAPTRASLLTGRYHQEIGVRSVLNGFEIMDPNAVTLAEILKQDGYQTALYGKWHLGEYYPSTPNAQGFDDYFGFRTGHTTNYFDPILEHNGIMEQSRGYITDILTDKAIEFMDKPSNDPFFCYLPYNAPHTPLQIERGKYEHFLQMGLTEDVSKVYGMIENIDENIGRIIDFLDASNQLNNTIVIFLSDNGPISGWQVPQQKMRYNAGLRNQKFTTYEGGIRTQCYWMWTGTWEPFYDTMSVAAHIDVVPTLAGILNISLADSLSVDGIDLRKVLEDHVSLSNERIYFEDYDFPAVRKPALFAGGMARKGFWKLHGGNELYNLYSDEGERINVATQYPEVLNELREAYKNYYKSNN